MKAAVYCGTDNLYSNMVTAAKSLAMHSSVDVIYFLTEDVRIPYYIPDYVKVIDVHEQEYFDFNGPNVYKNWSWMVLMRAALSKVFPQHDRILSLDVDTIVEQNIDELWDIDIYGYYLAGVPEPLKSKPGKPYVNNGVALYNLKMLRDTGMDDKLIETLNEKKYNFAEQDCINDLCGERIKVLPSIYNKNDYTEPCENPKILHFANEQNWMGKSVVFKYKTMNWSDARK